MSTLAIHHGLIVDSDVVTQPDPIERAMQLGKVPYAATEPAVYMCGQCRAAQIRADEGICRSCEQMFRNRAE